MDYGDLSPSSEELRQILGVTQNERMNQLAILHLAAALVRFETNSGRQSPPVSRVRLMAESWGLLESKQDLPDQESSPQSSQRWVDE